MGLLDSLASVLPYAIPAAAGAALGGPGLAMVGAGGAAQAQDQNLNKQIEIANLLNESQYRNADLGLRRQEIQSNEQLRKLSLQQSKQERGEALGEKQSEFAQREQDRQQQAQQVLMMHQDMMAARAAEQQFREDMARIQEGDKRDQRMSQERDRIRAVIGSREKDLQTATQKAWDTQGPVKKHSAVGWGGVDRQGFEDQYRDRNLPILLQKSGITPDSMRAAGFNEEEIKNTFPNYGGSAPAPSPSEKLKAAAKGGGGEAATFKTTMPDTPPGHAYHVNGKAYVVKNHVATEVPNG